MKYVFIIIWPILVILWTLIEAYVILIGIIFYLIWNLKFPKSIWKDCYHAEFPFENRWGGYSYVDNNIFYTIKRRILYTFTDVDEDTIIIDGRPHKKKNKH